MSLINVTNVEILDNPTKFTSPFQFEITFECLAPGVKEELEWKLVYVGSAEDEKYDQELDSVLVGPVVVGKNKFVFQAPAPDPTLIPAADLMEVTVLLLTCSYKDKEFIRIGYYVNNEYPSTEVLLQTRRDTWLQQVAQLQSDYTSAVNSIKAQEESMREAGQLLEASLPLPPQPVLPPPPAVEIGRLQRNILADKPRVTRFQIPWDEAEQPETYAMDAADEAKASAEATSESATAGGMDDNEEDEEDEEDDDEDMDEDDNEGADDVEEDEEEVETVGNHSVAPAGMHVE